MQRGRRGSTLTIPIRYHSKKHRKTLSVSAVPSQLSHRESQGAGVVPFCPHGLYSGRFMVVLRAANQNLLIAGGNHTLIPSMNHRRYIAWFHSTPQVIYAAWRAAILNPSRRDTTIVNCSLSIRPQLSTVNSYLYIRRGMCYTDPIQTYT